MPPDATTEERRETLIQTVEVDGLEFSLMVGGTTADIKKLLMDTKAAGDGDFIQTVPALRVSFAQPKLTVVGEVGEGDEYPGRPDTPQGDIVETGGPAQDTEDPDA
jgi:hypothetical protein